MILAVLESILQCLAGSSLSLIYLPHLSPFSFWRLSSTSIPQFSYSYVHCLQGLLHWLNIFFCFFCRVSFHPHGVGFFASYFSRSLSFLFILSLIIILFLSVIRSLSSSPDFMYSASLGVFFKWCSPLFGYSRSNVRSFCSRWGRQNTLLLLNRITKVLVEYIVEPIDCDSTDMCVLDFNEVIEIKSRNWLNNTAVLVPIIMTY